MTTPHSIALLGFTPFERSTFESFFRLAARRQPGYQLVEDTAASALIVANADSAAVMRELTARKPTQHVLLIGASDAGTGWTLLSRPIKLMGVLTAIDQMLSPRPTDAASFTQTQAFKPERTVTLPLPAVKRAPEPEPEAPPDDGILVVDDSDTALHFMQNLLRRVGFQAEMVRSGEEALDALSKRPYKFVFLDVTMKGMDGYQTCRAIKQRKYPDGPAPVIVMLTSRSGTLDKMRGTLAGADAYMVKPLEERELINILAKYDRSVQRGYQSTRMTPL
ncbi:MAG: response regulator [Burkholderiaceae bacterium]|nr:response regulator [Burkholderiaceae bacterium]